MSKSPEERIKIKKRLIQAYKNKFGKQDEDTKLIMRDLEYRLFAKYPTRTKPGQPDYIRDQNEGMRLAWLHIEGRINYNLDDLKLTAEDE